MLDEDRYEYWRNPAHDRYFFRRLIWASLLSGGHATYGGLRTFEAYDGGPTRGVQGYFDANRAGVLEQGAHDFRRVHEFFDDAGVTMVGLEPDDAFCGDDPRRWKCAHDNDTYIFYLANPSGDDPATDAPAEQRPEVSFTLPEGAFTSRWFDPSAGSWFDGDPLIGGRQTLKPPEIRGRRSGDWVLLVRRTGDHVEQDLPYPPSTRISGIDLDFGTHRRAAIGSDNFQLTWADDDQLYGAWGDGGGFGGTNSRGRVGLGVARIEGGPADFHGVNIWGGFESKQPATFSGKSWGMICVDGQLHMWVVPDDPAGKSYRNHYEYVELASSDDHGRSWTKAGWKFSQAEDLTIPTFLNFGRNSEDIPPAFGDYIYSYFIRPRDHHIEHQGPNGVGLIVHQPGVIYLARVKRQSIRDRRSAYEFFCGADEAGEPRWGSLQQKRPVFTDDNGVGWCLSACYHPALRRVLLCTEHSRSGQGLLGIFDAPTPWGPWTTVTYYTPEAPFGHDREGSELSWENNIFFASFPTKWFHGNRFALAFTGAGRGQNNDSFNVVQGQFLLRE